MGAMVPSPAPGPSGLSRRALLAASAGLVLLAAGCTGDSAGEAPEVTVEQADRLAGQVVVQQTVVAAYAAVGAADPGLAGQVAGLATQAGDQLDRLRAAAPGAPASGSSPAPVTPPAGGDVRGWLREQVGTAAAAHAEACVDQTGGRAALLGSIAAGLRGHEAALA
jgi:hypothetical protein